MAKHGGSRKSKIVWHYFYSNHVHEIIQSGALLPPALQPQYHGADDQVKGSKGCDSDRKLLLFSEREDWEPTSWRASADGAGNTLDMHKVADYARLGVAMYRIGVQTKHLKPYLRLVREVRMPDQMKKALIETAEQRGSNPYLRRV
ncbi:MAG TPA: hypothetical protein VEJ67_07250 [Candidatus Cybelea sp.]|nr:hypothetical protein [Candidatus Cybelea sp.]